MSITDNNGVPRSHYRGNMPQIIREYAVDKGLLPRSLLITAVALVLLSFCSIAGAAIVQVSGVLPGGTWSNGDTIEVIGNITLPTDSTLTIEPGVQVQFTGKYHFMVNGKLVAIGAKDNLIRFTAKAPVVDSLRWGGIRFVNTARGSILRFCVIEYGWARGQFPFAYGGGLFIDGSSPEISRCIIQNNRADGEGGGIYAWVSSATIKNNLVIANYSARYGGGMFVGKSNLQLTNCTFALDTARAMGGGLYVGTEGKPIVKNCIFAQNVENLKLGNTNLSPGNTFSPQLSITEAAKPSVSFSCLVPGQLSDPFPGNANINSDPLFINGTTKPYNFRLQPASPCIDGGDPQMNASDEPEQRVNRINMGAYGGTDEAELSEPVFYNKQAALRVALNFGNVRVKEVSSQDLTIENKGHYRLFIDSLVLSSADFYPDSAETVDGKLVPGFKISPIEPGEMLKFAILFKPSKLGDYADSVRIYSSDGTQIPVVKLVGTGINPLASLADSTVSFGDRQIGATHSITKIVRNVGESNLSVSSSLVQGTDFVVRFIRSGSIVSSLSIAPGQTGEIRFDFTPSRAEPYNQSAIVRTSDRNLLFTLSGKGVGSKMVIDTDSLFMGYVYHVGDSETMGITVRNEGGAALKLDSVTFNPPNAFSATLPPPIAPRDSATILVKFDPSAVADFTSKMITHSNYPVKDTLILTGKGMAEPGRYRFGAVSGNWTWSAGDESYIIIDSIYVPADRTLWIPAGARIQFEPGTFFRIDGRVVASGSETDSIHFVARDTSGTFAGRWKGIYLNGDEGSILSFCNIKTSRYGMSVTSASPLIQFCTFTDNGVGDTDTLTFNGGAIKLENSGATITGCAIHNNRAKLGGGIYVLNSIPAITNNDFHHNSAEKGGAIYLRFLSSALIQSNLIHHNSGNVSGGGIFADERSNPRIINNTIVDNTGEGVVAAVRSLPAIVNSILWGNSGGSTKLEDKSNMLVSYTNVEEGFIGTGNLKVTPGFVDPAGDYRLANDSPLIDKGNPEKSHRDWSLPPSKGTNRNDIGAYGGPYSGSWKTPHVTISVFRNQAFPQWLDFVITSRDTFQTAPTCKVEVNLVSATITLTKLDNWTYRGSREFDKAGTLFLTVNGASGGNSWEAGRIYDLTFISGIFGGTYSIAGGTAELELPGGSFAGSTTVLSSMETLPAKPTETVQFVSPVISIDGFGKRLTEPVTISIPLDLTSLDKATISKVALYQAVGDGWMRLEESSYNGIAVQGKVSSDGRFVAALDDEAEIINRPIPETAELLTAYPNPFNSTTRLDFSIPNAGQARLAIYDLAGRKVADLYDGYVQAGWHSVVWQSDNTRSVNVTSGLYIARLETAGAVRSVKLLLVR